MTVMMACMEMEEDLSVVVLRAREGHLGDSAMSSDR